MMTMSFDSNSQNTDVRVRDETLTQDLVKIQIDLEIPKSLFHFITWYCHFANLEPSQFIYSLIMHSLTDLVVTSEWEDYKDIYKNIGVR